MSVDFARRLAREQARRRAHELVAHAQAHSPWLARHYRGWRAGVDDWQTLPVIDKAQAMAHFDDWVTDRAVTLDGVRAFLADPARIGDDYLGKYAVWSSSGTSGHPGIFLHDGAALATYAVLTSLRMDAQFLVQCMLPLFLGALPWGGTRCALVAALDGHYAGVSFWQRQMRLNPWLRQRSLAVSVTEPLAAICRRLDAWRPSFLASYPSMLVELADCQRRGRLHIAPALLWAGGEAFSGPERVFCEQAFGAVTANDYGCSEALSIAVECRHGRLHLHDDWVLLEPVDAAGRPVPPGEQSASVLLTNLANRIAPIIRYDLGDSVRLHAQPCACGNARPTLEVQGRCDDLLRLRDAAGDDIVISPLALTTALEEGAGVYHFQVQQTAARQVALRLAPPDAGAAGRAVDVLRRFLGARGLPDVQVELDAAAPQAESRSGKRRRVIRAAAAAG